MDQDQAASITEARDKLDESLAALAACIQEARELLGQATRAVTEASAAVTLLPDAEVA
jgi:hypothetical protein